MSIFVFHHAEREFMYVCCYFSGLDAFQAEKVMETLRQLAEDGHTVICSIHQPRGSVYSKFDDIVLLSEGEVVYLGPAKEEPISYFASLGLLFLFCSSLKCELINNFYMYTHFSALSLACLLCLMS
jgi:energy-coupling factor transporter ATP-binding protein EcfA2